MIVEIEIKPIIDHEQYEIDQKVIYKDQSGIWKCNRELSWTEKAAFRCYDELILKKNSIKKHHNAIYRINLVTSEKVLIPLPY